MNKINSNWILKKKSYTEMLVNKSSLKPPWVGVSAGEESISRVQKVKQRDRSCHPQIHKSRRALINCQADKTFKVKLLDRTEITHKGIQQKSVLAISG